MKRILIITYYWPPSGGAGVQRWLKFVKYLREFGWEAVVYTPGNPELPERDDSLAKDIPPGLEVLTTPIREPYTAYKRFIGRSKEEKISAGFLTEKKKPGLAENISVWIRGNFFIPDARKLWIKPSIRYLKRYLDTHPVDAIATTGPPHSCHLIGLGIKRLTKLPWLADFRDPWTCIDFYRDLKLMPSSDRKHKRLEKEVLAAADKVIMISASQLRLFREICPREYSVITNGFDRDDYLPDSVPLQDPRFSIAHIGSLVPARNPLTLWTALQELCSEIPGFSADLEIKLVGKVDYSVIESLSAHKLMGNLNKIEYLPHDEVVKVQFQSRILLLLINDTPNAGAILTGKFFEYLAAGRPVLCIGPVDGDAAVILRETEAGVTAGYQDLAGMKKLLSAYYASFKNGTLSVKARGIEAYNRKNLTGKLADQLNEMLQR